MTSLSITRIVLVYRSIDRYRKRATFRTLAGARRWAHRHIGAHPEIGTTYAVSGDGVGIIEAAGVTLRDLFPEPEARPHA